MNEKPYNGWTNYETWLVHLWLTSDKSVDAAFRERARIGDVSDVRELVEEIIADQIQNQSSLTSDLSDAALRRVAWDEILDAGREMSI